MPTSSGQRVCVFLGASAGSGSAHLATARALGAGLAERGLELVYGGASVGCMGALAEAALAAGARVTGVIPEVLVAREVAKLDLHELVVVPDMHARKAKMASLAHAFVVLPGGFGTLEELFEVLTWAMLGLHEKPVIVIDSAGYFAPLLAFLDHATEHGFVKPPHRELLRSAASVAEALELVSALLGS